MSGFCHKLNNNKEFSGQVSNQQLLKRSLQDCSNMLVLESCFCLQIMSSSEQVPQEGPSDATGVKHLQHPVCLIILGMAGSGKTTFVQRLTSHLYGQNRRPYTVNLDPACLEVPYPANIG